MSDEKQASVGEALVEELARVAWEGDDAPGAWIAAREDQAALVRHTVRAVLSHLARRGGEEALGMSEPWPTYRAIERVLVATEHLLDRHNCDCHGYEEAIEASRVLRTRLVAITHLAPLLAARDAALEEARAELETARHCYQDEVTERGMYQIRCADLEKEAVELRARAEAAEKRLAAVLAVTAEDIGDAFHGAPQGGYAAAFVAVRDLIRSRATEGATRARREVRR